MENTYSTTAAFSENILKINAAVEAQRAIIKHIDPVALVIAWGVDHGDLKQDC